MAIQQPISTDYLNSPDHSLSHRVIANDNAAPAEAIVVDSAGNVGIGTTAPSQELSVNASNGTPTVSLLDNGTLRAVYTIDTGDNLEFGTITDNSIKFITNNDEKVRIQNDGNVGIGTTAPNQKLHVNGATYILGGSGSGLAISTAGDFVNYDLDVSGSVRMASAGNINFNQGSGSATFSGQVNFPGSGVWKTTGNVGIGTTTPTGVLHLKAGTASANTAPLKFTPGVLNTTPVVGCMEFIDNGTTGHLYITLNIGGVATRKEIAFV